MFTNDQIIYDHYPSCQFTKTDLRFGDVDVNMETFLVIKCMMINYPTFVLLTYAKCRINY